MDSSNLRSEAVFENVPSATGSVARKAPESSRQLGFEVFVDEVSEHFGELGCVHPVLSPKSLRRKAWLQRRRDLGSAVRRLPSGRDGSMDVMSKSEWDVIVAKLNKAFGEPLPQEVERQAFNDLADVESAQVAAAVEVLRLRQLALAAPTGRAIRRQWAELAIEAPSPAEAAAEIRQVFSEQRTRLGQTMGDESALDILNTRNPALAGAARAYEGPPPFSPHERRENWDGLYRAVVERERQRLLLGRVPAGGLPGLERLQAA